MKSYRCISYAYNLIENDLALCLIAQLMDNVRQFYGLPNKCSTNCIYAPYRALRYD